MKKRNNKLYVFVKSYDKQRGIIEKSSINLIANSLKDYINYNFSQIKAMTENKRLIKEECREEKDHIYWRFSWQVKEELYSQLIEQKEIIMRTAEIYFCKEPKLTIAQNRLDRKDIRNKKKYEENCKQ